MKFKNDKERIAFLEDYRNKEKGWYLWKYDKDLQRSWWRCDLPDCSLIVEENWVTVTWPYRREERRIVNWFIIRDWTFNQATFRDQVASRSMALKEIKRIERQGVSL